MNFKPYASNILHTTWMLRTSQKIWTLEVDVRPSATRETASSVPFGNWIRPVPHSSARSSKSNSWYLNCITERMLQEIRCRFLQKIQRTLLLTTKLSNRYSLTELPYAASTARLCSKKESSRSQSSEQWNTI